MLKTLRRAATPALIISITTLLTGCMEWDNADSDNDKPIGQEGQTISPFIYAYTGIAPSAACSASGINIRAGNDLNNNLVLDDEEVTDALTFCDDAYMVEYGNGRSFGINLANGNQCTEGGYNVSVAGSSETVCRDSQGRNYALPKRLDKRMMISTGNWRVNPGEKFTIGALTPTQANNLRWDGAIASTATPNSIPVTKGTTEVEAPIILGNHQYTLQASIEGRNFTGTSNITVVGPDAPSTFTDGAKVKLENYEIKLVADTRNTPRPAFTDKIVDAPALFSRFDINGSGGMVTSVALEVRNVNLDSPRSAHEDLVSRIERNTIKQNWSLISAQQPTDDSFSGLYTAYTVDDMTPTELARRIFVASLNDKVSQTFLHDDLPQSLRNEDSSKEFQVMITTKLVGKKAIGVIVQVVRRGNVNEAETLMTIGSASSNIQPLKN